MPSSLTPRFCRGIIIRLAKANEGTYGPSLTIENRILMQCSTCKHENRVGAKFCEECATHLARACSKCGGPLSSAAKFCPECANPTGLTTEAVAAPRFGSPESYTPKHLAERILNSKSVQEGERKLVTVLFADLKGSMELLADRDPEDARRLLDPVLDLMMEAVHRFEGTVNQVMGDGIMALFGAPLAHEDHAARACYAALRMQEAMARYTEVVRLQDGVTIRIRVGLNSGEVVVRTIGSDLRMDYSAIGQTTHLAARMEQLAAPGSSLLTADTLRFVQGLVEVNSLGLVPVKGLDAPVEVYELLGRGAARTRFQATATRGLTHFVGRDAEFALLRRAVDRARAGHGQVVAMVGEAGLGKSRLLFEFLHSPQVTGWRVLQGGALAHGHATAYLPVIDLLHSYFAISDSDSQDQIREKIRNVLGAASLPLLSLLDVRVDDPEWQDLDPPLRRRRILDALKDLVFQESRRQPLLVVFEDLHWADSATQAFLDTLVDSLPSANIVLLANYRPEYQHTWGKKTYYTQLRLDPLDQQSVNDLLGALLGDDPSLASLSPSLSCGTTKTH